MYKINSVNWFVKECHGILTKASFNHLKLKVLGFKILAQLLLTYKTASWEWGNVCELTAHSGHIPKSHAL